MIKELMLSLKYRYNSSGRQPFLYIFQLLTVQISAMKYKLAPTRMSILSGDNVRAFR